MKELTTLSGKVIPPIGLGTYPFKGRTMADNVRTAISIGYRLIDTADDYENEDGIGLGISECIKFGKIKREDIFLQSKISANCAYSNDPLAGVFFNPISSFMKRHSVEEVVREKVETSLQNLKTDYLDSLLIHYPFPGYFEQIWDVMISMRKEGKVRYIGVSNFYVRHLETIKKSGASAEINQIYLSPIGTKDKEVDYCNSNNIHLMTYSPLIDAGRFKGSDLFAGLCKKYGKTLQQILLRWNLERGSVPIAKSHSANRLRDNFECLIFALEKEDVDKITSLNADYQYLPTSRICPGF